jgi:hypothetical protein
MRWTCLVLLPLVGVAACTGPNPGGPAATDQHARQCFWASEVTSFGNAGATRVIANIYNQEKWELTLASGCSNANWAMRIGIVSRGSQQICTDQPAELLVPSPGGTMQRCLVSGVRKLSSAKGTPRKP